MLVNMKTGKTLIRLILQKQSDLCQHCLFRPFWLDTTVRNFRTFLVVHNIKFEGSKVREMPQNIVHFLFITKKCIS